MMTYLLTMAALGGGAAVIGAILYRGHRTLGAAVGFAIGIMISPLLFDMMARGGAHSGELAPVVHDQG